MRVVYNNLRHKLHDLLESSLDSSSVSDVKVIDYRGGRHLVNHPLYNGSTYYDGDSYLNQSLGIKKLPPPSDYVNNKCDVKFFEYSDLSRVPLSFYHLGHFESYLKSLGIYMLSFERNQILDYPTSYVTCVPNRKNLVIAKQKDALNEKLELIQEFNKSYS